MRNYEDEKNWKAEMEDELERYEQELKEEEEAKNFMVTMQILKLQQQIFAAINVWMIQAIIEEGERKRREAEERELFETSVSLLTDEDFLKFQKDEESNGEESETAEFDGEEFETAEFDDEESEISESFGFGKDRGRGYRIEKKEQKRLRLKHAASAADKGLAKRVRADREEYKPSIRRKTEKKMSHGETRKHRSAMKHCHTTKSRAARAYRLRKEVERFEPDFFSK